MADAIADDVVAGVRVNHRLVFVRWVRRTHGWFGLWGALLGLMTGVSGVWLNHRAVLKLALPDQQQSAMQVALPDIRPQTADEMAAWLQQTLRLDRLANNIRIEHGRLAPWAEKGGEAKPAMQPERWSFTLGGPNKVIQAEYWVGNRSVSVRTTDNGLVATLTNFHKGIGMPAPWILLIDTLAGSLIFLSVSGTILWWETNRRRRLGMAIFGTAVALTIGLAVWPLQP